MLGLVLGLFLGSLNQDTRAFLFGGCQGSTSREGFAVDVCGCFMPMQKGLLFPARVACTWTSFLLTFRSQGFQSEKKRDLFEARVTPKQHSWVENPAKAEVKKTTF